MINKIMEKLKFALLASVLVLAVQANAKEFDITFDIQGNIGSGVLTVGAGGLVTAGSVLVTAGDWASATPYSLAPNNDNYGTYNGYGQSSVGHFSGGADIIYDNIVYPSSTPLLDNDGLAFWTAQGTAGLGFNLWGNSGATDYTFYGVGTDGNPVEIGGTVTLTGVPDGGTTAALLGFGLVGCAIFSRKLKAA